jgi:hypothetical protein
VAQKPASATGSQGVLYRVIFLCYPDKHKNLRGFVFGGFFTLGEIAPGNSLYCEEAAISEEP